jgi:hypothetical protein
VRNNWLKFKTLEKILIILEEFMECTSNLIYAKDHNIQLVGHGNTQILTCCAQNSPQPLA